MGPRGDNDDDGENGSVLAPDELDIAKDENVVPLDEGRYVIASDEEGAERAAEAAERAEQREASGQEAEVDAKAVRRWAERTLTEVGSQYGFHISAKAEGGVSHQQMHSDDVGTTFDGLLMWYAQQLDGEMAVEDVLGILLTESNVRVRYSTSTLRRFVAAHDLGGDDTIADLFEAVDGDFLFPPDQRTGPFSRE